MNTAASKESPNSLAEKYRLHHCSYHNANNNNNGQGNPKRSRHCFHNPPLVYKFGFFKATNK
jgi:hypothetical protein